MPDDKNIRQPQDKQRIDIHDPNEVRNWCATLKVDQLTLKAAVAKVGTYAVDVRAHLRICKPK